MKRVPVQAILALAAIVACVSVSPAQTLQRPGATDYSTEAYVVEHLSNEIQFENDGTYDHQITVRVRVQSPAGVQSWGLIRLPYASASGTAEITSVRVTKADGSVVTTTQENVQDMPAQITVAAPFYSDLKEKQLAVRGLGVGDTLEYQLMSRVRTPVVAGQFWYAHDFFEGGIVLSNELIVRVPAGRMVQMKSPTVRPAKTTNGGYQIYTWKTANLVNNKTDEQENAAAADKPVPDVQLTTFGSWTEIANWYGKLQETRISPTADVRVKAEELTKGQATDTEKIRALYNYVALKFRYVGIAFGVGRYQPHSASEVLTNGYGDCKDKHTLLAALLSSVGIPSYPALINSQDEIDPEVPNPAQFDHVVTVVPQGNGLLWLDTTPEVAPFGFLTANLRDKDTLVVSGAAATLRKSPVNPPFRSMFSFRITGRLSEPGTLQAQAEVQLRGDVEVPARSAFHNTPQGQWKDVVQLFSRAWNFGGTVSEVEVSSPEATENPLALKYAYERTNYSRWPDGITIPLPPVNIAALPEDQTKVMDPVILDAPGDFQLEAAIELPDGVSPRLRSTVDLKKDFAEYYAAYTLEDNVLHVERRMSILMRDIPKSRIDEYRAFRKTVDDDGGTVLSLVSSASTSAAGSSTTGGASVEALLNLGDVLYYQDDYDGAITQYKKVLQQEPDNFRAHLNLGNAFYYKDDYDGALAEHRQAVRLRPTDAEAHDALANTLVMKGDLDGAVAEYRESLRLEPDVPLVHNHLGSALVRTRDWDGASAAFRDALRLDPQDAEAHRGLGRALSETDDLRGAIAEFRESARLEPTSSEAHRSLGYVLYMAREYDSSIQELHEAVRLDPKDFDSQLWLGNALRANRNYDEAAAAYRNAVALGPGHPNALGGLGDSLYATRDWDGAIAAFRAAVRANADDPTTARMAAIRIANALMQQERFAEAVAELQPVAEKYPQDPSLWMNLGNAQLRSGQSQSALTAFQKALAIRDTPADLNAAAYALADSSVLLDEAMRFAQEAVSEQSKQTEEIDIRTLAVTDLQLMTPLAAYWDTLGWTYFRQDRLTEAEKLLSAAWQLWQQWVIGDHLGQLYEKTGEKDKAVHSYALALAVPGAEPERSQTRSRLAALTGSVDRADDVVVSVLGELSEQRTVRLPRVVRSAARAEFFVLFTSDDGTAAIRFISGSEQLRDAGDALMVAHYDLTFPGDRPARIVRRGILDCPATGATCQFVLLPPESVTSVN